MPMIATTISSSMSVKPLTLRIAIAVPSERVLDRDSLRSQPLVPGHAATERPDRTVSRTTLKRALEPIFLNVWRLLLGTKARAARQIVN
jgi:hypothetical protein